MGRMITYISGISNYYKADNIEKLNTLLQDYLKIKRYNYRRDIQISTHALTFRSILISDENYREHRYRLMYENLVIYED